MCTAISLTTKNHYFGRNLDLDRSYGEEVCVMPRKYPLSFRKAGELSSHYAMIGMATVVGGIPLFYDAANERGLAMAGLNFPDNAYYPPFEQGKENIAPFEFIPWILGKCDSVKEARRLLENINLVDIPFSEALPLSPLHWMIADREECIVVESMRDGLHIHENPVRVMTNNPPFPQHLFNLNNYRGLRIDNGENTFIADMPLANYCQGLGAIGLPGDLSSTSRFVRAVFHRSHSVCEEGENASVSQFFHLLTSVEMPRGSCLVPSGEYDITVYSACVDTDRGRYYYVTYDDRSVHCVDMRKTQLDGETVIRFPLIKEGQIVEQN